MRPGAGGSGTQRPGIRPGQGGAGERIPGTRPGQGGAGERFPGTRPGQGGAGERWTPGQRHDDLANRFDDLQNHWNDSGWHHNQWTGPNGGQINHFGYWGPNGYWGHTGVWGANGGYWGHTGAYGPGGHWSRNWGWYNGYGPAWGNGRWNYLWDQYPVAMAFGMTSWGINCVAWGMGISSYYNPYYTQPVVVDNQTIVNYSQPIVGDPSSQVAAADATGTSADTAPAPDPLTDTFNSARQAFYGGDYAQALTLTNQALKLAPQDAAVNEFRSLCLFAQGQYKESAATIHAVLAAGPGWDWTTMISLYSNPEAYTDQLRLLETSVKNQPDNSAQHFLLGYHYLTTNHKDEAVAQWQQVVQQQPKDRLASELVQMYAPVSEDKSVAASTPAPDLEKPAYPLDQLQGDWKAHNDSGDFSLSIGNDDKFKWQFARDGKPQTVTGVYIIRGNNLVMQPDSGGTMSATITLDGNQLKFVPIGDAQTLNFAR